MAALLTCALLWLAAGSLVMASRSTKLDKTLARASHTPKNTEIDEYIFYVLKASLTGYILGTPAVEIVQNLSEEEARKRQHPIEDNKRLVGLDWPLYGYTMTGMVRLGALELALKDVVAKGVPGDFLEAGVWRGGSAIFARAVWNVLGQHHRVVHLADSFTGLPPASTGEDKNLWSTFGYLSVSVEQVQSHFERFGLNPHDALAYHKGFFNESLPIFRKSFQGSLSILRIDGDMYESAMDQLYNLYQFVPVGGWVIVDDYQMIPETKKAVTEFLAHHNAAEDIVLTDDGNAGYWVKTKKVAVDYDWYVKWCKTRSFQKATGGA